MFAMVESWQISGKTQDAYRREIGMSRSAFQSWGSKYREALAEAQVKDKDRFVPIKVSRSSDPALELVLPSGVQLRFYHPVDLGLIKELSK